MSSLGPLGVSGWVLFPSNQIKTNHSQPKQWELLRQLSSDSSNTIIGIVRNKPATQEKAKEELPERTNIHIVQADITDYTALKVGTFKYTEGFYVDNSL